MYVSIIADRALIRVQAPNPALTYPTNNDSRTMRGITIPFHHIQD